MTIMTLIDQIGQLVSQPYLPAIAMAYFIGQLLKLIITAMHGDKVSWRDFFASGNMPSTHTASVVALAATIGFVNGLDNPAFVTAALVAAIISYDACHVRRAVGENSLVLQQLVKQSSDNKHAMEVLNRELVRRKDWRIRKQGGAVDQPYFSRGHLPREVIVGAVLGLICAIVACLIW